MTRMERIDVLTAELRDLQGSPDTVLRERRKTQIRDILGAIERQGGDEQADTDRRMAEHFGIAVEDLDEYDSRIGTSIRDLALHNMEKWGEW